MMARPRRGRRWRLILVFLCLSFITFVNYRMVWSSVRADASSAIVAHPASGSSSSTSDGHPTNPPLAPTFQPPREVVIDVEHLPGIINQPLDPHSPQDNAPQSAGSGVDLSSDPPDTEVSNYTYEQALTLYYDHMKINVSTVGNVEQPTKEYVDVMEHSDHGVVLPHDPSKVSPKEEWMACDVRDAEFTQERDTLCQKYLSNLNNMRSIKAMSAILKKGRTIKFKLHYHHNNIEAIVKVSQKKFFFEPASEYLAYAVDRELNLTRTPTTAYVAMPLDFMRVASAMLGPFYSQWFQKFIPDYDFTKQNFVSCRNGDRRGERDCSLTAVQLWMKDVHSALMSNLAVPYEYDDYFAEKFLTPRTRHKFPPKPLRLRAIGDLSVRFIFDFLLGNTDRGMNDHNNFVYGGCDNHTRCSPRPPAERTRGIAKYAFIDQGSSFYSHKEPEENPFTGNLSSIPICRFRRSLYSRFLELMPTPSDKQPLVTAVRKDLPKNIFTVIHTSVFAKVQPRMEKIVKIVQSCLERFTDEEVFSLPEYYEV